MTEPFSPTRPPCPPADLDAALQQDLELLARRREDPRSGPVGPFAGRQLQEQSSIESWGKESAGPMESLKDAVDRVRC